MKKFAILEDKDLANLEPKLQKIYDVCMVILILLPIILAILFIGVLNKVGIGVTVIIISIIFIAMLAFIRKRYILSSFYKVQDVEKHCKFIEVKDLDIIDKLKENSALTFYYDGNLENLNVLYNWLNNMSAIKDEILPMYIVSGKIFQEKYSKHIFKNDEKFICISLDDLNLDNSNIKQFSENHFKFGRYLDDIIDNYI